MKHRTLNQLKVIEHNFSKLHSCGWLVNCHQCKVYKRCSIIYAAISKEVTRLNEIES